MKPQAQLLLLITITLSQDIGEYFFGELSYITTRENNSLHAFIPEYLH